MTDNEYRDMVIRHDKHIDKLAISVEHIATAVGSTNRKLEDIIDVISKQNILMEKFSNLETNLKESFSRVHEKIRILETTQNGSGCTNLKDTAKRVDKLEINQARVVWTVLTVVILAIVSTVIVKA